MAADAGLKRFIEAQERNYEIALSEIKTGRKCSHWMWYVFPQVKGLGFSSIAQHYAIRNLKEAQAYLQNPVLGPRLVMISQALLELEANNAQTVFGSPDDLKLKSSMTLFSAVPGSDPAFRQVLQKYFRGETDLQTLTLLNH